MKKLLLSGFILLQSICSYAQGSKGLYVDNTDLLLGNAAAEDSLLNYAANNGFNTLTLYKLHIVNQQHDLTQITTSQILADFIQKARIQYGILHITAIGENYLFFCNVISAYNHIHPNAAQRFDTYNLEFEFWNTAPTNPGGDYCIDYLIPNGYPCSVPGAYDFYLTQLKSIDSLAHLDTCISETYIGWPDSLQIVGMLPFTDRILLHAYVTNPSIAFGYTETRLGYLGSTNDTVNIIALFSSEPSFLGPWLASHQENEMFGIYDTGYNAASGSWKQKINLAGYQWFDYTDMPYVLQPTGLSKYEAAKGDISISGNGDKVYIRCNRVTGPLLCKVYDIAGREVLNTMIVSPVSLNILPLYAATGLYRVNVYDKNNNKMYVGKITYRNN